MNQTERNLHTEVAIRLKALGILFICPPNSLFFPARTEDDRKIIGRVVNQMKNSGGITLGAPDFVILHDGRACCIELKRPQSTDLLGHKVAAGRSSVEQKEFARRAAAADVPYVVCQSWYDVAAALAQWFPREAAWRASGAPVRAR